MVHDDLHRDLAAIEDALIRMGAEDGVWQNNVVRVLLRAVWHLLQREVRRC